MVPGTSFKDYLKYHYSPHKSGPKRQFSGSISQSLTNISRKTPFIFKGDSGRPRTSIPAKITPISRHQHIKITTDRRCLVCRNSNKIEDKRIAKRAYETIFQLSEEGLKEVKPPSKDSLEESKKIRDRKTLWKCSEYAVPICRPGEPY
jgi:rubredoxin